LFFNKKLDMKGRNLFLIGVPALAAGVALIFARNAVTTVGIAITCGVLFIIVGLLNIAAAFWGQNREPKAQRGVLSTAVSWVCSAAALILGPMMLIFQPEFAAMVPFMFGVLIVFGAIYQLFLMVYGCRPVQLPGWLYVAPVALTAAAIYLFVAGGENMTDDMALLITGISLAVFGLATAVEGYFVGGFNRARAKEAVNPRPLDAGADVSTAQPTPLDPMPGTAAQVRGE